MSGREKTVCAVLLAAGSSSRMGRGADGRSINKLLVPFGGLTPVERCVKAFSGFADELVIVVSGETLEAARRAAFLSDKPVRLVAGGGRRQDSVLNGVTATESTNTARYICA